jgi:sulfatase maturation enzyme AslB (radical SAM superfamily)
VDARDVLRAWGRILVGRTPSLSIEITKECPLRCPGCYAYGEDHLGGTLRLRQMRDYRGQDLVKGILCLVDEHRPLHVSLVGGEPLVRYRELSELLPQLAARGIHTQVVTSAVRPIPLEWRDVPRLSISVSIDGLRPEHDARRKPATYDRILKHIEGHRITVHCTITRQMTERPGYLREFVEFWSSRQEVRKIWMSIFTPQRGETSYEILPPGVRKSTIDELSVLAGQYRKLDLPRRLLEVYRRPPSNPQECIFARTTRSITSDLRRPITPCQFGGNPDCSQCGCMASAALEAIGRLTLPLGIPVGGLYNISHKVGSLVAAVRETAVLKPADVESQVGEAGS